jgi:hypothetical protein
VPDLAVANIDSEDISVLLGLGDGTFAAAVHYAVGEEPRFVAIGDLDGDQAPDLAVANCGMYPSWDGSVWILLGLGDGTFAAAAHYAAGGSALSVAIGDLDADQVPDLVLATHGTYPEHDAGGVSVLLGVGDGTFAAAVHYPAGGWSSSGAIGDLDGDQIPDLAVANSHSDDVSVLMGIGDGTFATAVHYAAGDGPRSVAIGDLDGDQVPDLAVANGGSNNISVLLGVRDRTFAGTVHYAAGYGPWCMTIGDLDGDQMPDLAVVGSNFTNNVSVLLNQSPTPGDMDGDDDVDLNDFALFEGCMGGPGVTTPLPGCDPADFERADLQGSDGDVDLRDCALFQQRFRGSP